MGTAIAGTRFDGPLPPQASRGASGASRPRGFAVYVHFPWCLAKCPYCDFVSYASPRESIDHQGYADAVIGELDRRAGVLSLDTGDLVESVFFGGGTPSLWSTQALGRVLRRIRSSLPTSPDLE